MVCRIQGAKALLEVLRLQIIAAKTPLKTDPKTKLPLFPAISDYTRYVTQVNVKGNEISTSVLQELAQYTEILKREDKRVEIRAALAQIDRNSAGGIDEDEFKAVLKLLTGTEPNKKEVKMLMQQHSSQTSGAGGAGDSVQKSAMSLENLLLAKCSSSPSKKAACPPWEALVQVRHATLGQPYPSQLAKAKSEYSAAELSHASDRPTAAAAALHHSQSQQVLQKTDAPNIQASIGSSSAVTQRISAGSAAPNANAKLATTMSPPPPLQIPASGIRTPQQQQSPVSSSSGSSDRGEGSAYAKFKADFKPPASPPPPLPLPQTVVSSASSPDSRGAAQRSVHSFSSSSRGSQENVLAEQSSYPSKAQTSSTAPAAPVEASTAQVLRGAPSSPDCMSVYSSSSSFSQFIDSVETPRQYTASPAYSTAAPSQLAVAQRTIVEDLEKKKSTPQHSVANSVISESPRWKDEEIFTDDEGDDAASTGHGDDGTEGDEDIHGHELDEDATSKTGGSSSNDFHSTGSVSSSSKASHNSRLSKSHSSSQQHQRIDSGTFASEIVELFDGEDSPAPPLPADAATEKVDQLSSSSRTDNDLSSLIYRANGDDSAESSCVPARLQLALSPNEDRQLHAELHINNDDPVDDDDDKDERVDSIVSDIVKDGKPRSVAKVVHTEFKRGLLLRDFPNEVPFRNLVALVLSENGLSSLALFKEVLWHLIILCWSAVWLLQPDLSCCCCCIVSISLRRGARPVQQQAHKARRRGLQRVPKAAGLESRTQPHAVDPGTRQGV